MDWIPVVFVTFKALALCTGMFFAIKWHYDQGKKGRQKERRAVLTAAGQVLVVFAISVVGLVFITFTLMRKLGLEY